MSGVEAFFAALWDDYVSIAPSAASIHALFRSRGESVRNDHVAFRTFSGSEVGLDALEPHFLGFGYVLQDSYRFDDKYLNARAYVHTSLALPRIFVSELCRDELDGRPREILDRICLEIPEAAAAARSVFTSGRMWRRISMAEYEILAARSEYAAWVAALGMHANHFTISVNELVQTPTLLSVLDLVEAAGFPISNAGGRVKGSKAVLLEQGSTRADRVIVAFADGEIRVPTCYTEFALRYPDATGTLYDGFVPESATHIFESTER